MITFSETLNGTINYGLLHIRDTGESAGGISLEDATSQDHAGETLTVILTSAQQDDLANMDTPQLDIEENAVFDLAGNPIEAAPDQPVIIDDHTPPEIVSAEYSESLDPHHNLQRGPGPRHRLHQDAYPRHRPELRRHHHT